MSLLTISALLGLGFVLLFAGGEGLVRGAAALGLRLGLTPVTAGLTIVAFGTSAPELAVSIRAAMDGVDGLAVGNVVGSNICNVALILGLVAVLKPIRVESVTVQREVPVMILATLLIIAFLFDGHLSRLEGAVLVAGLVVYVIATVRRSRKAREIIQDEFRHALPDAALYFLRSLLILLAGLAGVIAGGYLFVEGAVGAATRLEVPPVVIGLTIVAVGTSLPEIATSLVAALRGYGDMATGNVIGSNIFNIFGILGVTTLMLPLSRGGVSNQDLFAMLLVAVLVVPMMMMRSRIGRGEGVFLLLVYAAYMTWLVTRHT